jgi:hypothetical protein
VSSVEPTPVAPAPEPPAQHLVRATHPFLIGAYLAVNAIPDTALVVDGPDCVLPKAEHIQGNHDLHSTLLSCERAHRILHTNATVTTIPLERTEPIKASLWGALARPQINAVLLTALPMAAITDPPYELLLEEVRAALRPKAAVASATPPAGHLAFVPPGSLDGDWLDGFDATLLALARTLPLAERAPQPAAAPPRVAIVGYLMDRNEADHAANLAELARLVAGFAAALVSVWPSGRPVAELARAAQADLIVSLPYGRKAAEALAQRTGAPVVHTALPMGLDGTAQWVRAVAHAAGRAAAAEAFLEAELSAVAPRLEWVVPLVFLDRRFGFAGDPHLARAFIAMVEELGGEVPFRILWARPHNVPDDLRGDPAADLHVLVDPRIGTMGGALRLLQHDHTVREGEHAGPPLHLLVGNSHSLEDTAPAQFGVSALEFGFPSFHSHALFDRPFLGFRGCLCLAGRMAERIRMDELLKS